MHPKKKNSVILIAHPGKSVPLSAMLTNGNMKITIAASRSMPGSALASSEPISDLIFLVYS